MKVFPVLVFVLGVVFTVFGTGFAHEGNDVDVLHLLLGLLQTVMAAAVLGWIPMPTRSAPPAEHEDLRNKH
jgi:uncharacterized membrane protein YoaK (UPF0700 family)